MTPKRLPSMLRCLAFAALLAAAGPAAAPEPAPEWLEVPGAGPMPLLLPRGAAPLPVVVLVPDPGRADRRRGRYAAGLRARGIATIDIAPGPEAAPAAEVLAQRLGRLLRVLVADPRIDAGRIALLGFGAGGRIALGGAGGLPVAALGAGGVAPGEPGRLLLLEEDPPSAEAHVVSFLAQALRARE